MWVDHLKASVKSVLYFLLRRTKLICYDLMQKILLVAHGTNSATDAKKLSVCKNGWDVTESEAG